MFQPTHSILREYRNYFSLTLHDEISKFPMMSQCYSYFIAHILEFQLYEALCIEAGEYDPKNPNGKPLHKCDFYNSKAAGKKLS